MNENHVAGFKSRALPLRCQGLDRDIGGFVKEAKAKIDAAVKFPSGYYPEWGGQFQNMERALRHLTVIVPITIGAIFFLLFTMFRSIRLAALIITVLPFASIGGVIALFVTGEYVSVPASVGFITLWGIAVLNGVVMLSVFQQLRSAGLTVADAVREGSMQRLRTVLMTAMLAALHHRHKTGEGQFVEAAWRTPRRISGSRSAGERNLLLKST